MREHFSVSNIHNSARNKTIAAGYDSGKLILHSSTIHIHTGKNNDPIVEYRHLLVTIFPYTVDYRKKLNTMNVFLIVVSRFFFMKERQWVMQFIFLNSFKY